MNLRCWCASQHAAVGGRHSKRRDCRRPLAPLPSNLRRSYVRVKDTERSLLRAEERRRKKKTPARRNRQFSHNPSSRPNNRFVRQTTVAIFVCTLDTPRPDDDKWTREQVEENVEEASRVTCFKTWKRKGNLTVQDRLERCGRNT